MSERPLSPDQVRAYAQRALSAAGLGNDAFRHVLDPLMRLRITSGELPGGRAATKAA